MRIAVVCANIGGIDSVKGMPKQNMEYDYYYFHDGNLPFPLPNLDNRLKSKYIKIMMHRFLPHYDAYVWLDGKVQVHENNFVELMTKNLQEDNVGICVFPHPDGRGLLEEMNYIISRMRKGSHYLLSRYGHQQMEVELQFYIDEGFTDQDPLYAMTTFSRLNEKKINVAFDEWWLRSLEFSSFDQAMFSWIDFEHFQDPLIDLKIRHVLDYKDFEKTFSVTKHIN